MRDILTELENAEKIDAPDPMVSAQKSMQANLPKRFYQQAKAGALEDGAYGVFLDGKPVKTPAKAILKVSNKVLADKLALEWQAIDEIIDPRHMPLTRLINTALDGVACDVSAVVEDILRFASNDLLYYRAEHPAALCERQSVKWDPVLEILESRLGVRFELTAGIIHVAQCGDTLNALRSYSASLQDPLQIAALHTMTTLTGSALLAFCVRAGDLTWAEAWDLAHLDEDWNIEQWGHDFEAQKRRDFRRIDMQAAGIVLENI